MTTLQFARRLTGLASTAVEQAHAGRAEADRRRAGALDGGRRDAGARRLLVAGDALALTFATAAAALVAPPTGEWIIFGALTVVPWMVLFRAYGLYDRDLAPLRPQARDDLPALVFAGLVACLAIGAVWAIGMGTAPSALHLAVLAATGIAAALGIRAFARHAASVVLGPERVLLVGDARSVERVARRVSACPELGLETAGVVACDGKPGAETSQLSGPARHADLSAIAAEHGVTHVLVASPPLGGPRLLEQLRPCRRRGIKVSVISAIADAPSPRAADVDDGLGALGVEVRRLSPLARAAKRTVDLIGSALALVLAAPLMLLIAIAVKLDSPGPVLFRQERIGYGGRAFRLVKFRTMVCGAEEMTEALRAKSLDADWLLLDRDPRVTRFGRFLRQWSLDELPQLWNVLRGEMSLVGPRPLIVAEDDRVHEWARARGEIAPGLTGLWQATGRTNMSFEEMIRLDCIYVSRWSFFRDLGIIARTVPAVLTRRGAN